ncbi:MAG: NADH-quinone oxidoreductase subunit C, partial [Anaerolineales bacterium]|nr:NADH-quinone oxidoreductase subunit C [Anaerolineales bacterium]
MNLEAIDPWIEVAPDALLEVCTFLRDDADLRFDFLSCISGVDYFEADPKKVAKLEGGERLEVVYHLWSVMHKN